MLLTCGSHWIGGVNDLFECIPTVLAPAPILFKFKFRFTKDHENLSLKE